MSHFLYRARRSRYRATSHLIRGRVSAGFFLLGNLWFSPWTMGDCVMTTGANIPLLLCTYSIVGPQIWHIVVRLARTIPRTVDENHGGFIEFNVRMMCTGSINSDCSRFGPRFGVFVAPFLAANCRHSSQCSRRPKRDPNPETVKGGPPGHPSVPTVRVALCLACTTFARKLGRPWTWLDQRHHPSTQPRVCCSIIVHTTQHRSVQ